MKRCIWREEETMVPLGPSPLFRRFLAGFGFTLDG